MAKKIVGLDNKQYKQNLLVLYNLNEIYAAFKEKNLVVNQSFQNLAVCGQSGV